MSCRIIAGLRPSVRTTGAAAMMTVALCSLRRRADFSETKVTKVVKS